MGPLLARSWQVNSTLLLSAGEYWYQEFIGESGNKDTAYNFKNKCIPAQFVANSVPFFAKPKLCAAPAPEIAPAGCSPGAAAFE